MKRILFVDDTFKPHIWKSTIIDVCTSASEAISLLKTNEYSLVSLDYDMPGMTGLDLLKSPEIDWNELKIPFFNIHSSHGKANTMVEYIRDNFNYRCIVFKQSKITLIDDSEICLLNNKAIKKFGNVENTGDLDYIELKKDKLVYRIRKHYSEKINTSNNKSSIINIKNPREYIKQKCSEGYDITHNPFNNLDCSNVHVISCIGALYD